MLTCLRISELAIAREVEVDFGRGLNVVTGETGAGKSILVSALQLVLGGRGRAELVRGGAEQAEVEALFDVGDDPAVRARCETLGIPADDELVVRRVLLASGRSRAYVNGRLATAAQLEHLAAGLVDISSQHEHHSLVDPSTHLDWLDAFAGLTGARETMREAHRALAAAETALGEVRGRMTERATREDLLRYQLGEIERVAPSPGEDVALEGELDRLRHASRLAGATAAAEEALYAADDAIGDRLARLGDSLAEAAAIDRALEPLVARLEAARVELEDVARELGRYARGIDADPGRLGELEDRLASLRRLSRRHGGTLEALIAARDAIAAELAALEGIEDAIARAEATSADRQQEASAVAAGLSRRRHEEAARLGASITAELASLGMGGARVEVSIATGERGGLGSAGLGAGLGPTGLDRVEFLIAPNRGEEPRPLRQVASGGELSRALLALKRVLAGLGPVGLYVFDEVDTGVGGAVAETIGRKLHEVSRHHQVLCITHLAPIAAYADHHFKVRKGEVGGRTESAIERLDDVGRTEEVARMIGGLRITDATRQAAAELIRGAAV